MNQIREYLNRPLVAGIVGLVVGLILGLVVLGWGLFPVQWYDAAPSNLHQGYQDYWMQMTIVYYGATNDTASAKLYYDALGDAGPAALARIKSNPRGIDPQLVTRFETAVGATPGQVSTTAPGTTPTSTATKTGRSNLVQLLIILCVVTVLIGGAIVAYFVWQGRKRAGGAEPGAPLSGGEEPQEEWTSYPAATSDQGPMAQFMASYKAGDDMFDDSFSIDSPSGEFLGECGVGISETIGVGAPKRVTAFEVWLFDKNDIQTVTKVLMSAHAFNDLGIRSRLEAKGEPFEASTGGQTVLETATLRLVARVVDMAYGQGPLPDNSYFDSLVLELAIWQK